MPHYKDGTEAHVGDYVTGHCYNTDGIIAGTIISITPGMESCNAMVQFTRAEPAENAKEPRMAVLADRSSRDDPAHGIARKVKGRNHGSEGPEFYLFICADYCAVNELTLIQSSS
jgi:hypothetical protein